MIFDLDVHLDAFSTEAKASFFVSLVETLVHVNRMHLDADRDHLLPSLYRSRVVYRQEPTWKDLCAVLSSDAGDCKDLVAWRIAELRALGVDARVHVVFYRLGDRDLFHLQIKTARGVEDPSACLGMKPLVVEPG